MARRALTRTFVAALALSVVAAPTASGLLGLPLLTKPALVTIGYAGSSGLLEATLGLLGATLDSRDDALKVLVVKAPDPLGLISLLLKRGDVRYAELTEKVYSAQTGGTATRWSSLSTDATRWSSTEDSATRWSGTDWEATRWSASGWDASGWDASGWDATRWSASGWDATRWSGEAEDGSTDGFGAMDPGVPYQWGLGAVNAPGAWSHTVGTLNRAICVIDSGVDHRHPDLAANMWSGPGGIRGHDYVNGDADPMDDAGHGTHVAGIAAAVSGNGLGVAGLAQARIMAVKVLDAHGVGRESDAAFALRWCADNGANVATLSLGTSKDKQVLRDGVDYAAQKGMLVVAAAGNEGCACPRYPAALPGVLAIASYGQTGARSSFSNTGSWVSLSGPGEDVTSTYAGGTYRVGSGTSQATPFAAGAAALAWGANPALTAAQVRSILLSTAWDLGPAGKDASHGHGGVDAHKAVEAALALR